MFKTILWATDGSETAAKALRHALGLAEPDNAKLVVAHVREIFVGRAGGHPVLADEAELRDRIHEQVEDLQHAGREATFIVRTSSSGQAARTIAKIADDVEADVIVVGTHGYGRVTSLVLGSVTQGLLHEGTCPVFAVPTGTPVEAREHAFAGGIA